MEEYKLSIANIIFDSVQNRLQNQMGVTKEMILGEINATLNNLNLDVEEWFKYIYETIQGNRSQMPIYIALSQYGYDKALENNSNPSFSLVWVEIVDFIEYLNLFLPNELFFKLESSVDDLTKKAIKKEYSWDKRVLARFIVKKGYENSLKISDNPDEDLIRESTFEILGTMYGFENPGLLFAVRDLLEDKFYNEGLLGEAVSKIAMEDILRMSNSDDIDFLKWIGRKGKLIQDLGYLGDEEVTNKISMTNYKELYLKYLKSNYDIEDAVINGFILDLGNRHYARMISKEYLLEVICATARMESQEETHDTFDPAKTNELKYSKIIEMLEYFGWENDDDVFEEIMRIEREYAQRVLEDFMANSPF